VTSGRGYVVACLAGDGIGPEVMAEASRAVAAVSRMHGFAVDEVHVPFGGEAFSRHGHRLPSPTRTAYRDADAVLVAAAHEPALEGVASELDLRASVTKIWVGLHEEVTVFSPLSADAAEWTVSRAFDAARASCGRVSSVSDELRLRRLVDEAAGRNDGVLVEHVSPGVAVRTLAFDPALFDVLVAPPALAETLSEVAASSGAGAYVVAEGRLGVAGPGVFTPAHGSAHEIAGQGVANPSSMLLAVALMLGEGLGERTAAETLGGAVAAASGNGIRTPDMLAEGVGATTREFGDVVLSQLRWSVRNAEFLREAWA
jgi:3-isopropylmalate dehydrogenase